MVKLNTQKPLKQMSFLAKVFQLYVCDACGLYF